MLKNEGLVVNHKRTYRIYRQLHLQVRTQRRKKFYRPRISMLVPDSVNQCWSVDFACDQLASGRRFRVCNIVDHFSRECVAQITDFSISGERLVRELDQLARTRPLPGAIVMDNGPEPTSKAMFFRSRRTGVKLHFIRPGNPTQNAFVESFNGEFRDTCLNQHWFLDLDALKPLLIQATSCQKGFNDLQGRLIRRSLAGVLCGRYGA